MKNIALFQRERGRLSVTKRLRYHVRLSYTKHQSRLYALTLVGGGGREHQPSTICACPLDVGVEGPGDRYEYSGPGIPETFILELSYTAVLFWTLFIDLYEEGRLFGDKHVGRVEIRLSEHLHIERDGQWTSRNFEQWFNLYEKQHAPSAHSMWHWHTGPDCELRAVGRLRLSVHFHPHMATGLKELVGSPITHSTNIPFMQSPELLWKSQVSINGLATSNSFNTGHLHSAHSTKGIDSLDAEELSTAIKRLQHLIYLFGQGIQINTARIILGYSLLYKFYQEHVFLIPTRNFDQVDRKDLALAKQLWPFCTGSFGWKGIVLCRRRKQRSIIGIAKCDDLTALVQHLNLAPDCIVQFRIADRREPFVPAYFLARHPAHNCLVLTIRGTCDYEDTNIDLACEYVPFKRGFVHYGIWKAATWLLNNVYSTILHEMQEREINNFYITGHSLGGAVGCVFYLLLKDFLRHRSNLEQQLFVTCKCISFGAAPTVSLEIIEDRFETIDDGAVGQKSITNSFSTGPLSDNIINIVYGYDVIPSLCYGTVMDFRQMILCASQITEPSNWLTFSLFEPSPKKFEILRQCRSLLLSHAHKNMKLYLPGKVYHAYHDDDGALAVELSDTRLFNELIFRKNCFTHHMPTKYDAVMDEL